MKHESHSFGIHTQIHRHTLGANRQSILFIWLSSVFLPAGSLRGDALVVGQVVCVVVPFVFVHIGLYGLHQAVH